jgi:adenylate cyclase
MPRSRPASSDLLAAIAIAVAAFAVGAGLREGGALERLDLSIDDALVRATHAASPDPAFFVILEREEDLRRWGFPLSDEILARIVDTVTRARPLALGIDKYRDRPVPPGSETLDAALAAADRVYWVSRFGADPRDAIPAPKALPPRFAGCGDMVDDVDGAVRRALIYLDQDERLCYSLAYQLARHALVARGRAPSFDNDAAILRLGDASLRAIDPRDGPYFFADTAGFQVPVPSAAGLPAIESAGLSDLLDGKLDPARMKDRIVLFGSEAQSLRDFFNIPVAGSGDGQQKIAGVQAHALIASYLLHAANSQQPALRAAPAVVTLVATAALAILAAYLACLRARPPVVVAWAAAILAAYGVAVYALGRNGVLMAPAAPALALAVAFGCGVTRTAWLEMRERAELMAIFGRHVSPEVANALWQERGTLIRDGAFVPRTIEATVLFLDIRGFTSVFEQLPGERAVPWLNTGLAEMTEAIMKHQGVVARFIGDSIMAVFGAPVPRATADQVAADARNAIESALEVGRVLARLNAEFSARSLPPIRVRVGINTGTMTQCSVGTERRMEFTLLGDAVNTASRLESYAMPDDGAPVRILIGERTMRLAGAGFATREVGSIALKGKEVPVMLYQVMAP